MAEKLNSTKNIETHCRNKLHALVLEIRGRLGADGVVQCVRRSLSKEELAVLQQEPQETALSAFATEISESSGARSGLQEAVAKAAQAAFGGRRKAARHIKVPGYRLWGRVRLGVGKKKPGRKSKVHAPDISDKVRVYLLENSAVTSKLMKFDGQVVPVYNLKASRGRLWARSDSMQALMSRPIWYKHLKAKHANFVRLKCRTDVCTFCHKFDKVVLPALRKDLDLARSQVESAQANYFESLDSHWEAMKRQGRTDADDQLSLQFVKFLKLFLDRNANERMRQPSARGTLELRQRLKEAEASAVSNISKYVEVLESCSHHFQSVRRQHAQREHMEHNLPKDSVLIQLDFMENMTWPLGPEEAQDWFWATSRESMTTLGFYVCVWRGGVLCKENYHYISQVLNHDSAYACQCLRPGFCSNGFFWRSELRKNHKFSVNC